MLRFDPIALDAVPSTQVEAERRIADGQITKPTLITARRQTAGRGSRGRAWVSAPGNLYASYALKADPRWKTPQFLPFAAALAVGDAVQAHVARAHAVRLKWPNDILVDGAKVGGILITAQPKARDRWYVIGVGVNVAHAPGDTPYPAACLGDFHQGPLDLVALTETLSRRLGLWIDTWLDAGYAALKDPYLARSHPVGQAMTVAVRGSSERVAGHFGGLGDDGALLLDTASGRRHFYAADVFPDTGAS